MLAATAEHVLVPETYPAALDSRRSSWATGVENTALVVIAATRFRDELLG